jgi:ATP diphosphatase
MDDVPSGLPELLRARKLQKRAGEAGFDWPGPAPVVAKLQEELQELDEAMQEGDEDHVREELGDFLFAAVNLARKLKVDPGRALREANAKFEARFRAMEERAGGQAAFFALSLEQQEVLWQKIKSKE